METVLDLDQQAYEGAKRLAQQQARPLGKVVSDLILRGLASEGSSKCEPAGESTNPWLELHPQTRFPMFKKEPTAPTLTSAQVRRILDDED